MTTPTLTVPVAPRRQMRDSRESRATVVQFGDGYAQASTPVNPFARRVQLSWRLSWAEAAALEAFLVARGGGERFLYALPGEAAKPWRCPSFAVEFADDQFKIVSASFEEQV